MTNRRICIPLLVAGLALSARADDSRPLDDARSAPAVDCTDEFILARGVPECAAYLEKAEAVLREHEETESQKAALARASAVMETAAGGFDGDAVRASAPVPALAAPLPALEPAKTAAGAVPIPHTAEEKKRFWRLQGLNQAAFAADIATTVRGLRMGGSEANPLLALFGAKNIAGVVLSALALHVAQFLLYWWLFKGMTKLEGEARMKRERLIVIATLLAAGVHVFAAIHNYTLFK